MTSTETQRALGRVLAAKGWEIEPGIGDADRTTIEERVLLLPAWADNQLEGANLDVRPLQAAENFYRLRVGDYRVVFQRLGKDIVVHRVGRREDIYDRLQSLVLIRSGDGYLTPSMLDGRWMARVSIGAETTEREHVAALWDAMRRLAGGEDRRRGSRPDVYLGAGVDLAPEESSVHLAAGDRQQVGDRAVHLPGRDPGAVLGLREPPRFRHGPIVAPS